MPASGTLLCESCFPDLTSAMEIYRCFERRRRCLMPCHLTPAPATRCQNLVQSGGVRAVGMGQPPLVPGGGRRPGAHQDELGAPRSRCTPSSPATYLQRACFFAGWRGGSRSQPAAGQGRGGCQDAVGPGAGTLLQGAGTRRGVCVRGDWLPRQCFQCVVRLFHASGLCPWLQILLVGDSGVGKSSLLVRFTTGAFEELVPTIGTPRSRR